MDYDFLFDKVRRQLVIGYNVARASRDASYYDLLASEARLVQFRRDRAGTSCRRKAGSRSAVCSTSAGGEPVLLSWSGSMFEYLMPLLVMPTYENTLLDQTYLAAVERQIEYGRQRGVPWGMSESGYNTVDVDLNYQYRAFGVPGLGLKRGLGEDLVVAPYASALALMVAPEAACLNLQRLAAEGLAGRLGLFEAIDYTPSRQRRGETSAVVRSFMAHHQGMSLLALRLCTSGATDAEALRVGSAVAGDAAAAAGADPEGDRFFTRTRPICPPSGRSPAVRSCRCVYSPRRTRPIPEVQLLSNGRYHVMVTNAGGGNSRWKDLAVTRWREDGTSRQLGQLLLSPRRGQRRVLVDRLSADAEAGRAITRRSSREGRAEFRRRDFDFETHTEIVVSPEDDIEVRRIRITNRVADAPRDRRDELRGGGSRAGGRGCAASGVQQSVRADRDPARAARDSLHPPSALAATSRRRGCFT